MIKSYTDLSQSRKLAEILPIGSADMKILSFGIDIKRRVVPIDDIAVLNREDEIPCWSLSALLGILKDYTLQTNSDGTVFVVCEGKKPMISDAYNNPVDACVAMIERLHELNLLLL